jgi:hypothetical protein
MAERTVKTTVSGWRPWAIGAVLSVAGAAFLFVRWQRKALETLDSYEAWWQHRAQVRANGQQPSPRGGDRSGHSLFV